MRLLAAAFAAAAALAACDAGPTELDEVQGIWELQGDNEYYVRLDTARMTIYDYRGDAHDRGDSCFVVSSGALVSLGNGVYRLGQGNDALIVEMRRSGSTLTINFGTVEVRYGRNSRTEFTPVCTAPAT